MSWAPSHKLLCAADRFEFRAGDNCRLGGFGARFEANAGSLDPLHVRLVLLQQGVHRVLWVSCDLLGMSTRQDRSFREQLAFALGVGVQHVIVSCTHTHSAPVAMPARGPSGVCDEAWLQREVFDRTVKRALALEEQLRPVQSMMYGEQPVTGLGYNRQDANSPIDEHVRALSLLDKDNKPIVTIINYALHPVVIGEMNFKCSADYPGQVCGEIELTLGGVAMFIGGSGGDVDPVLYRDQGRNAGTRESIHAIGKALARGVLASLKPLPAERPALKVASTRVSLPLDPPQSLEVVTALRDQFANDQARLEGDPADGVGRGAAFQLVWAQELLEAIRRNKVPADLKATVSVISIGPMRVLCYPFELYSQIGLRLHELLAPRPLMIAAYTHGLIGYVVTTDAKKQGGYGAGYSHRYFPELMTAIGIGADDRLVEAGVSLVRAVESDTRNEIFIEGILEASQ